MRCPSFQQLERATEKLTKTLIFSRTIIIFNTKTVPARKKIELTL